VSLERYRWRSLDGLSLVYWGLVRMTEGSGAKKWKELLAQPKHDQASPGDVIAGRFRVDEHLGTGGMGVVISAFDEVNQQEVALKILRVADVDETATQRFIREARTSMRIESPYVVKVLDTGMDAGRPFMVMERLHGMDLSDRLRKYGPVSVSETADIMMMICEALANAHGAGIVHRDIKLSNLFMAKDGRGGAVIKVLDFGISKARIRGEYTLTESNDGSLLGSPPYMAPEQIRNAKTVDHRADLWSLGVVAYRLLSGEHPYHGDSVGEVFANILERRFNTLASQGIRVPDGVEAMIATCMQVDLGKRYQSVAELALALDPFASAYGQRLLPRILDIVEASPAPALAPSTSSIRRDKPTATGTLTLGPQGTLGLQPDADSAPATIVLPESVSQSTGPSQPTGVAVVRSIEEDAEEVFEPWYRKRSMPKILGASSVILALGVVLIGAVVASSYGEAEGERPIREVERGFTSAIHANRARIPPAALEETHIAKSVAGGRANGSGAKVPAVVPLDSSKPNLQKNPYPDN
jgi:eukaryotic-like serine/threonine-protein kinase